MGGWSHGTMIEIVQNKNNKETISSKSQCHSLSNKIQYRKSMYVTILENETTTDTVADSAATCHFFPNEEKEGNKHDHQIEGVYRIYLAV